MFHRIPVQSPDRLLPPRPPFVCIGIVRIDAYFEFPGRPHPNITGIDSEPIQYLLWRLYMVPQECFGFPFQTEEFFQFIIGSVSMVVDSPPKSKGIRSGSSCFKAVNTRSLGVISLIFCLQSFLRSVLLPCEQISNSYVNFKSSFNLLTAEAASAAYPSAPICRANSSPQPLPS